MGAYRGVNTSFLENVAYIINGLPLSPMWDCHADTETNKQLSLRCQLIPNE